MTKSSGFRLGSAVFGISDVDMVKKIFSLKKWVRFIDLGIFSILRFVGNFGHGGRPRILQMDSWRRQDWTRGDESFRDGPGVEIEKLTHGQTHDACLPLSWVISATFFVIFGQIRGCFRSPS